MIWFRKPSIESAIRIFLDFHEEAKKNKEIKKPISFSLYKTWEMMDAIERERK